MDKLLREALESDALPPADLTDRIMAQVAATPQNAARRKKNPYWKWMVSAAACLVVAAAAIPLALNSRSRQDAMSDMAAADAAVDDSREEDMVTSAVPGSDTCDMQENRAGEEAKKESAHDQPYDPMDTALDSAARLLHQQGYVLEVTVRGDTSVQVTASDGSKKHYYVEPVALIFNEDNYYLMAYSSKHPDSTANYRIDRIDHLTVVEESVMSNEAVSRIDGVAEYTEQVFKMFSGELEDVVIQFSKQLIGPVFDKFGEDTPMMSVNETTCAATVHVQISPPFFGWLAQFGSRMRVISPGSVIRQYQDHIKTIFADSDDAAEKEKE